MNEKKSPYKGQAKRMVERWAGKRIDAGRNHPSSEINHQRSAPHPFIDQDTSQIYSWPVDVSPAIKSPIAPCEI
jgi:hypothetical protein